MTLPLKGTKVHLPQFIKDHRLSSREEQTRCLPTTAQGAADQQGTAVQGLHRFRINAGGLLLQQILPPLLCKGRIRPAFISVFRISAGFPVADHIESHIRHDLSFFPFRHSGIPQMTR